MATFLLETLVDSPFPNLFHLLDASRILWLMASGPITSWQIDGETMETVTNFVFGLQNHCRWWLSSVQSLSHVQLFETAWTAAQPSFPVHHQLPELTQTHVHPVSDAIQPSYPLSSLSPSAFNLSQHQGLFQWVSSSHQVAKVLEFQLQSIQWIFRTDFL